jgi:hypothetical protein
MRVTGFNERESSGKLMVDVSAAKPQSPLTLQWENATTFQRVSEALNLPPTYVSALYHASGHVELSRIPRTGQAHECIGK